MATPRRNIVYVSCSGSDCIDILALDHGTGTLTHIESVPLPGNGMPLAISPGKQHLYAAVAGSEAAGGPKLLTFQIAPADGRLHQQSIVEAPGRMSHITVDRSGSYVLGASVANELIASYRILPDGALSPEPAALRLVPGKAHHITTDLTNTFVYVPNLGADLITQLTFNAETGRFENNAPAELHQPIGAAPRHIAHHPSGRFAYLLNEENGSVAVLEIDAVNGTLSQLQTSSYLPAAFSDKPWGAQILVTPDGRFLYTSERRSSTLALHTIDAHSGMITHQTTWPTETCPRNFTITQSSQHLIAAGEKSDRVACYAIDPANGHLHQQSVIATSSGPLWVEALELS